MKKLNLAMLAGLAACAGTESSETAPVPPSYRADEPNDGFDLGSANVIVPEAPLFLIEGNIHAGDLDCMIVLGELGVPFNTTGSDKDVRVQFDYAAGWDMDLYIGYTEPSGDAHYLWQAFDEWGVGNFDTTVTVPAGAISLRLAIGQNTLNMPPDETRYTITVEKF